MGRTGPEIAKLALASAAAALMATGALAIAPQVAAEAPASAESQASRLRDLFVDDAAREDTLDPLAALYRGDNEDIADLARIYTDALARDQLTSARRSRDTLATIHRSDLPADLQISYDVFAALKDEELTALRPEVRALTDVRPFNHFGGLHVEFPSLIAPGGVIAYADEDDYARALALYRVFPQMLDNAIQRFREGLASQVIEPRLTVENMIAQIDAILARSGTDSPFLQPLNQFPETVSESRRDALRTAFTAALHDQVLPAYRRLRTFLAEEYLPAAPGSVGLSQMKGGAQLYRVLIHRETTLPLDPGEVHRLGLSEVARIRREMEGVQRELGGTGDLGAFFDRLRSDPRFHPKSAEQLAQGFARIGREVDAALPRYFAQGPAAPLLIEPYPVYRGRYEAGGSYAEGSPERGRPGVFFFNTYDLPHRFLSGMTTLYLHEAVPGHHLQITLARANADLPPFQRYGDNSAFVEGWALYAETLGYPMGLYADPLQHWGTLDDEMLRAMRLVVDTGIHAQGWSRSEAIDYMLANSGMGRSDAQTEVDRYIAMPAQALSYKIGALTIQRLQAKARAMLGDRFDIRGFHAAVLGYGSLPLPVLETVVDLWIAQVSSPPLAEERAARSSNR
ncbi:MULTISPECIES: DUF885 family protein [unclassified Novosphingobium]|uniref:DUF885 domain-containing protein n=1 Tax=unclassified Novosphingobium TaxID=2644732 RepID=UPI001F1C6760|nr:MULTISPECIES: DUF885 domain-containing protein [unclassified Novosphingobium]